MNNQVCGTPIVPQSSGLGEKDKEIVLSICQVASAYVREARFWQSPDLKRRSPELRAHIVNCTEETLADLFLKINASQEEEEEEEEEGEGEEEKFKRANAIALKMADKVIQNKLTGYQAAQCISQWVTKNKTNSNFKSRRIY